MADCLTANPPYSFEQISSDLEEIIRENGENAELIAECKLLQEEAEATLAQQEQNRENLETSNQLLQAQHENTERSVHEAKQQVYSFVPLNV